MTYIIAGQVNNLKFLMSDCVATDNTKIPKRYTFAEKTKRLLSDPNTYFALAGVGNVAHYIEFYDNWLYSQDETSDFIGSNKSLKNLVKFVISANERSPFKQRLKENRIFFLRNDGVYFCQLDFDSDNNLKAEPKVINIASNSYIDSCFDDTIVAIGEQSNSISQDNLREYCLKHLHSLARMDGERAKIFSSRIQFTVLNDSGVVINESAFKYPSDILSMYFDKDFKELDNPNFIFTV